MNRFGLYFDIDVLSIRSLGAPKEETNAKAITGNEKSCRKDEKDLKSGLFFLLEGKGGSLGLTEIENGWQFYWGGSGIR